MEKATATGDTLTLLQDYCWLHRHQRNMPHPISGLLRPATSSQRVRNAESAELLNPGFPRLTITLHKELSSSVPGLPHS